MALCLLFPLSVGFVEDSRRWDSVRSRWRARSFLRFAASEASSSSIVLPALSRMIDTVGVLFGTFELCLQWLVKPRCWDRAKYHERSELLL